MAEFIHFPPILFGFLLASSAFPDHLSSPWPFLASLLLTIVINWTGWLILAACLVLVLFLLLSAQFQS